MNKKSFLLLIVIYITFIALGLPDALLGSAWNSVREDLHVSLGYLGIMTFLGYFTTIFMTLNAPRLLRFFQTKYITLISVTFTGVALLFMSQVTSFTQLVLFAFPLGFGAGAIDMSLNHYLAMNYKAHHMNYLHSFYGIGVTFGPTVMAYSLENFSWRLGYLIVGSLLLLIALILLISLSLWKHESREDRQDQHGRFSLNEILRTPGVFTSILIFVFYVNLESLAGAWVASYFFITRELSFATAALFASTFFLTFTVGRFFGGFLSHKIHSSALIRWGEILILIAGLLLLIQVDSLWIYFFIVGLLGLGCAPIYPNMMYLNAVNFDKQKLSRIISLQMGLGYLGFGFLTPLYGWIFDLTTISIYPFFIIVLGVLISFLTFWMNQTIKQAKQA